MSQTQTASFLSGKSEEFIERALAEADMNALRIALYHQTGDPELAAMKVEAFPLRGGAFEARTISREHFDLVKEKARQYLNDPDRTVRPAPSREEAHRLMEMFQGRAVCDAGAGFGYEDLAFDDFPRATEWGRKPDDAALDDFMVTIIGAGFSGIVMAITLDRLGIRNRIIDRYPDIGGTWHANDYPQARVDVPTFLYQYKFELDYKWKSYFASQAELIEYVEYLVDKHGLRERISLSTELKSAHWNEATQQWDLCLSDAEGQIENVSTNVVVSAAGLFTTPKLPDIKGIESFKGKMFHTTSWDHDFDYSDKRVAVIGTGSTGTQLVPEVARKAGHLTVFQRTANWITPVQGYHAPVSEEHRWLFDTMPFYLNWYIYQQHVADLWVQNFQDLDLDWISQGGRVNQTNALLAESLEHYIAKKTEGRPDLTEKLIPDHAPVSRRLVIDNGFYDALMRDNVELETGTIERFTQTGIVTADSKEREFDLVVLSAGFHVSRYLWPVEYVGREETTLEQLWDKDGARAHLGLTLPQFPNFFVMYGPNAQARAGSFHSWVEILSRYIAQAITGMIENGGRSIEVKRAAFDDYNRRMDEAMKSTLWETEGQGGYYVNEHGRSGVNMPWRSYEFYEMVKSADLSEFEIR